MGSLHTKPPTCEFFKRLYEAGLQEPRTPEGRSLIICPAMAVRHGNKLANGPRIAKAIQLQLYRYAAARAELYYELHTGRGGAKRPRRHWMMLFCHTLVRWSHPSPSGANTKGGNATEPTTLVPITRTARARSRVLIIEIIVLKR